MVMCILKIVVYILLYYYIIWSILLIVITQMSTKLQRLFVIFVEGIQGNARQPIHGSAGYRKDRPVYWWVFVQFALKLFCDVTFVLQESWKSLNHMT